MKKKGDNLSGMTIFLMVFTAGAFDLVNGLINSIPLIGQIASVCISIFSTGTFWLWFTIKGYPFTKDMKRAMTFFGLNAVEFIPVLNSLPATTASVIMNISMIKLKDAKGALGKKIGVSDADKDGKNNAPTHEQSTDVPPRASAT